jgi:hypothetical protein
MTRYCLDANIFIQSKNGPYGFDIVPRFWAWIDEMCSQSIVYSSIMVYNELVEGTDQLSVWVKDRRARFVEPSQEVQSMLSDIAGYVLSSYEPHQAEAFLGGADPWVIAQGKTDGSTVVTHEALASPSSKKVKIPNVCAHFGVLYVNLYDMMRTLGARFT